MPHGRERESESERVSEIDRDRERMLYVQMSSKTYENPELSSSCRERQSRPMALYSGHLEFGPRTRCRRGED